MPDAITQRFLALGAHIRVPWGADAQLTPHPRRPNLMGLRWTWASEVSSTEGTSLRPEVWGWGGAHFLPL